MVWNQSIDAFLKQTLSEEYSPPTNPLSHSLLVKFSPVPHGNYKKIEVNYSCILLTTCIVFGQGRVLVIVVVINAPHFSSSLNNRAKESKLQPPSTAMVVLCERTLKETTSSQDTHIHFIHA